MVNKMSKWVMVGVVVLAGASHWATAAVLTVGQSGADYTSLSAALNGVTEINTTVRFIDSATYDEALGPSLTPAKYEGLTIESATGQKATVNFTASEASFGLLFGRPNMTLRNIKLVNSARPALFLGDGNATNLTITGVDFVNNVTGSGVYLVGASPGMNISYSTFRGYASDGTGGPGLMVYLGTGVPLTVDHCSFDNLGFAPIKNGVGADMTVTNCAFGVYNGNTGYKAAIYVAGTLFEDFNVSYLNNLAYHEANPSLITHGGNSFYVASYGDIFAGNTAAGDWSVVPALYEAASDGTTIGAWQAPTKATVQGTVVLNDYFGDGAGHAVPLAVRVQLTGPTTGIYDRVLDASGQFTIDNVTLGSYTVAVKSYAHLQKVLTAEIGVGATDLGTFELVAGDTDGDNEVTTSDLATVLLNMDQVGD